MNIEQIEAFLFVAVTSSFSKAGESLYTTQPTVSTRIKSLESALNCKLFNRAGNNVTLTKEGEAFLPYAKNVFQNLQAGKQAVERTKSELKGEIEISAVFIAAFNFLPFVIKEFHDKFPKTKINLLTGHSPQVLDMVLKHQVKFGITRSVTHPKIDTVHLFNDEMILAVYPEHPFQCKNDISMEEIAVEKFILYNQQSIDWTLIHNAFDRLHLPQNVIMEVDNIEVVKRMVEQKMGIAILPRSAIQKELKKGTLLEKKVSDLPYIKRDYDLIHLKDTPFDDVTEIFVDFLLKYFSQWRI